MGNEETPQDIEMERVKRAAAKRHIANEAYDEALRQGADPAEIPVAPEEPVPTKPASPAVERADSK
jgi:hypothetical protein